MSARRHATVFPGFKEMAERRQSVSGQLLSLRRELGLSQAEVAARMGTSQSAVARFEAGDLDVRLSTVQRYTRPWGRALNGGSSMTEREGRAGSDDWPWLPPPVGPEGTGFGSPEPLSDVLARRLLAQRTCSSRGPSTG